MDLMNEELYTGGMVEANYNGQVHTWNTEYMASTLFFLAWAVWDREGVRWRGVARSGESTGMVAGWSGGT